MKGFDFARYAVNGMVRPRSADAGKRSRQRSAKVERSGKLASF